MAISKRLANQLDGDIALSSCFGEGSTFSLTVATGPLDEVPMINELPQPLVRPKATPAGNTGCPTNLDCRILLAEDSPDSQRLFQFLLQRAGAEVAVVGNGRLALERAMEAEEQRAPFDVILMDMQMPEMDGYQASRELRKAGYAGPIVALTAHAMAQDRKDCLDAGCDDVGVKPIDRETLLDLVARHCSGKTADSHPAKSS